jgi:hypothetical protein
MADGELNKIGPEVELDPDRSSWGEGWMGSWAYGRGWSMDSLDFHPGPALLRSATPFQGWPTHRAGGLRPSSTLLDTPRRMPMVAVDGVEG